ncbi:hypothetical protein J1N35_022924, partial [Gossypium stocksii]
YIYIMPSRRECGSLDDDASLQSCDGAQMGQVKHFMLEMVEALQHIVGANVARI